MISASIRFEGPSFFNIVLQPYSEAKKHFARAIFPDETIFPEEAILPSQRGTSLLGRAGHIGAGLLLMIPIINSIVMSIIIIGFKPRLHGIGSNLIILLEQLKNECPDTNDPQVLINYYCPRSLFPNQPNIENLGELEPVIDEQDILQAKETYLLMQLCEALYYVVEDDYKQALCNAFIRLGEGWSLGMQQDDGRSTWKSHVGSISMMFDSPFIRDVQARDEG